MSEQFHIIAFHHGTYGGIRRVASENWGKGAFEG